MIELWNLLLHASAFELVFYVLCFICILTFGPAIVVMLIGLTTAAVGLLAVGALRVLDWLDDKVGFASWRARRSGAKRRAEIKARDHMRRR